MVGKLSKNVPQYVLDPWTEVVGTLVDVLEDSVTIATTHEYTLSIGRQELDRSSQKLKRGSLIGVLQLPDGSVRVRGIPHRGRINGERALVNER